MHTLPILARLPVEHGVLVAREHLRLGRHLFLPAGDCAHRGARAGKRGVDGCDDAVDVAQAGPVSGLLGRRETPGDLPVKKEGKEE